jgi:RNA polymerase sigma-70 factor (ECF subfamily)
VVLRNRGIELAMKREMQVGNQLPPDKNGELSLLRRVADRDRDALTELYRSYHARLFKFVYRLTSSYTIAEELETEVMLTVWEKAPGFREESRVSTWIFGIAYKMALRRLTRERLKVSTSHPLDQVPVESDAAIETEDWVRQGILSLPPAQRITVMLVFYLGLTYEETAAVTGCPVNTVKTRMFHARRKLKEFLEDSALPTASKS